MSSSNRLSAIKLVIPVIIALISIAFINRAQQVKTDPAKKESFEVDSIFTIVSVSQSPVITKGDPGTEDNKYGFEGGKALKFTDGYHIFTTEIVGDPIWTKTRLAHWKSEDGKNWERLATLFESTGDFTGKDPRAALWSPMPTYHSKKQRWMLTYVAYRSKPQGPRNADGHIWLAASTETGISGIGGPYKNQKIILEPGTESDPWEGLMGTNSFYPFAVGSQWYAFYGSSPEVVGLAGSSNLEGTWMRKTELNPVKRHIENPVVTRLPDGRYVAFFDGCSKHRKIGYMISYDGLHWSKKIFLDLQEQTDPWWGLTRTPLGLIQESSDLFTLYFTAYNNDFYNIPGIWKREDDSVLDGYFASVGMMKLKPVK